MKKINKLVVFSVFYALVFMFGGSQANASQTESIKPNNDKINMGIDFASCAFDDSTSDSALQSALKAIGSY